MARAVRSGRIGGVSQLVRGNSTDMLSSLNVCVKDMREKRAALESVQETSRQLLHTISCGDAGSLGDLLDARAAACAELGRAFSAAPPLDVHVDRLVDCRYPEAREVAAEIAENRRSLESLVQQTLATQNECEQALRAALAQTARQLRETVEQNKVRSAYSEVSLSSPRFLDSRK